jgi:uncharacterized protein involved in exopolysaccharide biosynthesis
MDNHEVTTRIDLLDILIIFSKYKIAIIILPFVIGFIAILCSFTLPDIFRSEITIVPVLNIYNKQGSNFLTFNIGEKKPNSSESSSLIEEIKSSIGGSYARLTGQIELVLKSREFIFNVIDRYNLMPLLYRKSWDEKNQKWLIEKPPTKQKAYALIISKLEVSKSPKFNSIFVSYTDTDPVITEKILSCLINGLSEYLRSRVLEKLQAHETLIKKELTETKNPIIKSKLEGVVTNEIEFEMLVKAEEPFGFEVIDPPVTPEDKYAPKRAQIGIITVLTSFFAICFFALFRELIYIPQKNKYPQKFQGLKMGLKLGSNK